MGIFRVPPGAQSRPHYHANCESACYMVSGSMEIRWGERLEESVRLDVGDLLYVPPHETHVLRNLSDTEPAEYVVAPQPDRGLGRGALGGDIGVRPRYHPNAQPEW